MKVLFLTQWYPSKYDAMAGLFVRKHAEAVVRQGIDVCVLYCEPVQGSDSDEVVFQTVNGVQEIVVYYSGNPLTAMYNGKNQVLSNWGMPDLCQINVLSKSAMVAGYFFCYHKVPYIIVEHWSGYLPANGNYLKHTGLLHRLFNRYIANQARCIMPVSNMLMQAMQQCGLHGRRWEVLHNVVDDFFYTPDSHIASITGQFRLLHVSCFDEKAKNIQGILRAIKQLSAQRQDFRLTIVGTGQNYAEDRALSDKLGLTDRFVFFRGELSPKQVYQAMREADAFVLFSRYENAPVVLSECMAVGLPIIASRAGGIPEMVCDQTGILVPSEDEKALTEAIRQVMDKPDMFNREQIKEYGKQYTYQSVGEHLRQVYESVLS